MGPTQLLKTELINNIVGYHIDQDPAPMIVMQPTGKMAEAFSKDRLDKMLRDTPVLAGLVKDKRSKDAENTILHKAFPGGHITIVGSNSPSDLAMRPVRLTLRDEVDKYPESAGKEGDPSSLIIERSDTFWNAKDVGVCSPTVHGRSRIEEEYEQSDKRVFHGKCPHCKQLEELKWENVKWDEANPESTSAYVCSKCNRPWTETDRLAAVAAGEYVPTAAFTGHAGFKVNKLASPWQPVSVLVGKWLRANTPEKLKTFVNTQLAETWVEKGEVPEWKRLYERREQYALNTLPPGVVFLTCGVDVQKDRLELEIVGWGRDKQSWSIDFRVIPGDTASVGPWLELDKVLDESWITARGLEVQVRLFNVDAGYNTNHVHNWVRRKSPDRVRAIRGSDSLQMNFGTPKDVEVNHQGARLQRALKSWPVGVSVIKSELYNQLRLDGAGDDGIFPPGFCHFPQFDEEHFKRLCSEQLVKKTVNGRTVFRWIKVHERNEVLDCRVYARAAAAMFGIDRFTKEEWNYLEGAVEPERPKKTSNTEGAVVAKPVEKKPTEQPAKDEFWGRQNARKNFW